MGAVFAIERDGVVYIASDAVKGCCGVNFYVNNVNNLRLHKMPSGIVIAANGAMAQTQRLWLHDEWFEIPEGEVFDKKYIVTRIIPKFYDAIKDMDVWETKEDEYIRTNKAGFLIAKGADIFAVFDDLSVVKCDKIAAIDEEDADMIMLSYANACREEDPEMVIKKTYEFASSKVANLYTHGYIINTRDLTFKRMEDVK